MSKKKKKKINQITTQSNEQVKKVVSKDKDQSKKVTKKKKVAKKKKVTKKKSPTEGKKKTRSSTYELVIVESPSKAKTIKKYLGRGFQVIASNGHIKDLPKSKLGVDVKNNFKPEIVPISGKKNIFERIEKYKENATKIYLAPDPDREGEAIAFHLSEVIGKGKEIHRVLFNAITKKAILEAMKNPTELDQKKYDSQRTRRILDRLVGYKISPILWDKVQRGLSAGRVQSVALRMMVEREEEIQEFKPEQWFDITAELTKDDNSFKSVFYGLDTKKKKTLDDEKEVLDIVKNVKGKQFNVTEVIRRERKYNPTPPFTTAKLQQEAASKLGFTANKTMMLAQRLYEGLEIESEGLVGLVTYIRTDSVRTEPEAIDQVREYIKETYGDDYLSNEPIIYKKRKGSAKVQDAHEAIRPTFLTLHPSKVKKDLDTDEFKLYELIWNKFLASQMAQAIVDLTTVYFQVGDYVFKSTGSIIKFPGFRKVFLESMAEKASKKPDQDKDDENALVDKTQKILPNLEEKEVLKPIVDPVEQEHWTSPPPRYGDASIVKDLEEKGVGRPSTYASIISNIIDKGYVEKIEGRYVPTQLGIIVCKMLIESFPKIMDIEFTAKVEELLDGIAEEGVKWTKVLKDFWGPFEKALEKAKEEMKNLKKTEIPTGMKCRKCEDGEYLIKWGRNGQFFACSNYPDCTSTEDFRKHLDGTYEIIPKQYTKDPCPTCGKGLVVKKGKYGRFVACEEYPNCKTALPYLLDIHCPVCKVGRFAEKKSRYGKIFYGCSTYPECDNAMWDLPREFECPSCHFPVMGQRETKRIGKHLKCPKCAEVVPLSETPFANQEEENKTSTNRGAEVAELLKSTD